VNVIFMLPADYPNKCFEGYTITINEQPTAQVYLFPCGGRIEYLHGSPASRRRRRKWNPGPGVYWAILFLGDINTGTWP
jgi:hypothetical protein